MDRSFRRNLANNIFIGLCGFATLVALGFLVMILWSLLSQGIGGLDLNIFTKDQPAPGSVGGLRNAIVGSIEMCALGMVIAVIVGILAGTWLAEYGGKTVYGTVVRFFNDVLLSAPSILVGLFVYVLLVETHITGFSGYAGSIALAILAVPIVTRTTEDMLLLQPNTLREAGMALGAGRGLVIRSIIWKAAGAGLLTGGLLGFARISGETAPLIFTAFGNLNFKVDLAQPMASLPGVIFQFALSAYDDWRRLAWVGALLITFAVLAVNTIGRYFAREKNAR
jgi:phosphate transport system permease protein